MTVVTNAPVTAGAPMPAGLTDLRDTTADIVMKADADGREPTAEELHTFHTSMGQWMFAPGQRASFTAQDIAAECLLELATVESVLSAFSIGFDSASASTLFLITS